MDWQYEVSAGTKKQFGILKKLMAREDEMCIRDRYGLGLEIAAFCTAENLDQDAASRRAAVWEEMAGLGSF